MAGSDTDTSELAAADEAAKMEEAAAESVVKVEAGCTLTYVSFPVSKKYSQLFPASKKCSQIIVHCNIYLIQIIVN